MYVIKIGSAYFDGSSFVASQRDAKRFHSATQTFRDYVTLLFGDARFVKLVQSVTIASTTSTTIPTISSTKHTWGYGCIVRP